MRQNRTAVVKNANLQVTTYMCATVLSSKCYNYIRLLGCMKISRCVYSCTMYIL